MASPPPNPDMRELPYGWTQQYNWEFRQWFYVNTRENPPRSSWEHPLGPMRQGYAPPPGPPGPPPPDRSYSHSPYGGPPGYGGYPGYQQSYGGPQGYYNASPGGYAPAPHYHNRHRSRSRSRSRSPERVVYVEEEHRRHNRGPGWGTAALAGGAGLVGGVLLTEAFERHEERERDIAFDEGFEAGFIDGEIDGGFF